MFPSSLLYARRRPAIATWNVQLYSPGGSNPEGSSVARHASPRRRSAEGDVEAVRRAVFGGGPAVDSAGTAVARPAVTGVLLDSQRDSAHGATRLQPVVPLVRGFGDR